MQTGSVQWAEVEASAKAPASAPAAKRYVRSNRNMNEKLAITVLVVVACSCATLQSDLERKLSHYHPGYPSVEFYNEMHLSKYPSRLTPNLRVGEEHELYFLPSGNLHVMTSVNQAGISVLSNEPFFTPDTTPVAEREKKADVSWEEYVKELKARHK